ncbi:MAG: Holliday junction branch migration protein RuvA [Clostridia bacterium]|nr:Holliday junction branch migration protein RuvA [Clostridia bacterium]
MIAFLQGTVIDIEEDSVILNVGGVGYRVFLPDNLMALLPPIGAELQLHVEQEVREDRVALYGFKDKEQLQLYRKLISVTGIGPKVALGIIGATDPGRFIRSILNEELNYLTKLPGVGKKTAQRLILELKDKLTLPESQLHRGTTDTYLSSVREDALEALVSLGYQKQEVLPFLAEGHQVLGDQCGVQELVRFVLKAAGKNRRG